MYADAASDKNEKDIKLLKEQIEELQMKVDLLLTVVDKLIKERS